jgi:hypothetical protein
MLKRAGIERPHPMLRKVHALAVVARLNVMMVGGAGCGKTMLGEQLAKLMGYAFGLNSMTAGTSESALTGWLLPVGEAGRFEYVPAPFVTHYAARQGCSPVGRVRRSRQQPAVVAQCRARERALSRSRTTSKSRSSKRRTTRSSSPPATRWAAAPMILYTGRTALDALDAG